MAGLRVDGQAAGTVEGQVSLGKDHRVDVVIIDGYVFPAVGQGVLRTLCQGDKHLVSLQSVDGGGGAAGDVRPRQHQLYLLGIAGVYNNLAVI